MKYILHHIHLICSDLEEMIAFFTGDLGAGLVERRKLGGADGAILHLSGTPIYLRVAKEGEQIATRPDGKQYGYDHFGLGVPDVYGAYQELLAKGYTFPVPPANAAGRVAFFKGPDNIDIELFQVNG